MSRVEEIERLIDSLTPDEFDELLRHVRKIEADRWDAEMDQDAAAGRLDFLRSEAVEATRIGTLRNWPSKE